MVGFISPPSMLVASSFVFVGSAYRLGSKMSAQMEAAHAAHAKMVEEAIHNEDSVHSERMTKVRNFHQKNMSMEEAWSKTKSKDHPDVKLIQEKEKKAQAVTEEMIDKARNKLNIELVEAYEKLDETMAECSNLWKMNKNARDASMQDDANIKIAIKDADAVNIKAGEDKVGYTEQETSMMEEIHMEEEHWAQLEEEMNSRIKVAQDDMAVNMFILSITGSFVKEKYGDNTAGGVAGTFGANLLQHKKHPKHKNKKSTVPKSKSLVQSGIQACRSKDGLATTYKFTDPAIQAKLDALQAHRKKDMQKLFHESFEMTEQISFLELSSVQRHTQEEDMDDDVEIEAAAPGPAEADANDVQIQPKGRPVAETDPFAEAASCDGTDPSKLGVLHDRMSMMFGGTADELIDAKKAHQEALAEHEKIMANAKAQSEMYTALIREAEEAQSEAERVKDELHIAFDETYERLAHLEDLRGEITDDCKAKIQKIMEDEVCGVKQVRDAIQMKSTENDLSTVQDCIVESGFVESPCEKNGMAITCTPEDSEDKMGGMRTLSRGVYMQPNERGAACPDINVTVPCGRNPCPVDCEVDHEKLVYGTCNKQCATGTPGEKMATMSVKKWPKHGGAKCPLLTFTEICAEEPCDLQCVWGAKDKKGIWKPYWMGWPDWSGCSRACTVQGGSPGFKERRMSVMTPAKGNGWCPPKGSKWLLEREPCNEDIPCVGDEECHANMDLVILIDSSGSVGETNFKRMQFFIERLMKKMKAESFGTQGVNVAAVQYGNGFIVNEDFNNPVVSSAIELTDWTTDYDAFLEKVKAAKHARGFTNLAQGFLAAKKYFEFPATYRGARLGAAFKKVLVLTDGTVAFKREAEDVFEMLDNNGIRVNAVIFNDMSEDIHHDWKNLVTIYQDSILQINSFDEMNTEETADKVASEAISAFCPESESPSQRTAVEQQRGFSLYAEDTECPGWHANALMDEQGNCINGAVSDYGMCTWHDSPDGWKKRCNDAAMQVGAEKFNLRLYGYGDYVYFGDCIFKDMDPNTPDDCKPEDNMWAEPGATDGWEEWPAGEGFTDNIYVVGEM